MKGSFGATVTTCVSDLQQILGCVSATSTRSWNAPPPMCRHKSLSCKLDRVDALRSGRPWAIEDRLSMGIPDPSPCLACLVLPPLPSSEAVGPPDRDLKPPEPRPFSAFQHITSGVGYSRGTLTTEPLSQRLWFMSVIPGLGRLTRRIAGSSRRTWAAE